MKTESSVSCAATATKETGKDRPKAIRTVDRLNYLKNRTIKGGMKEKGAVSLSKLWRASH